MKKLNSFQKFCARFSRRLPGAGSIATILFSSYAFVAAHGYFRQHPSDQALHVVTAGCIFMAAGWIVALFVFPKIVGSWKARLPEEAIKYARQVIDSFPEAAEALNEWIKVAEKYDDGTMLQTWACYFEQMKQYGESKIRLQKGIEELQSQIRLLNAQMSTEIREKPEILH